MSTSWSRDHWLRYIAKPLVFLACLVPFGLLVLGGVQGDLGANPLERVTHATGNWGLRLLLITLAITPLRRLSGWARLLRLRRMLGLFAFFYLSLHFLTWVWLDQELVWGNVVTDIAKRPYVTVGFGAWLLLLPLAVTSTRGMMRRLGRNWQRLHRLIYVAGVLGVLHYIWLVKADLLEPLIYAGLLGILLAVRWRPQLLPRANRGGEPINAR